MSDGAVDVAAALSAVCQGCSAPTDSAFQCPLCQAEAVTDRGYYCSQECFAANWLEHRNTRHKSGVVREKRRTADAAAATPTTAAAAAAAVSELGKSRRATRVAKRARADADADDSAAAPAAHMPWPPLPASSALITPALPLDTPRAVVRPAADVALALQQCMWPAMQAAAEYVAASVRRTPPSSSSSPLPPMRVLVVAGDVYSAHAFAWAARCAGLTGVMQLAVSAESGIGDVASPTSLFTQQRCVVVATAAVVRASALVHTSAGHAVSGAASLWLAGTAPAQSLVVTLPDVADAEDLQGVQTRAVFFAGPAHTSDDDDDVRFTYTAAAAACEDGRPLSWAPVALLAPGTSTPSSDAAADTTTTAAAAAAAAALRLDDTVSTCLANGDLAGAVQWLSRCYQHQPGHLEATLFYSLCCNWGAASVVHAHHRLAYIVRALCDCSARFDSRKGASLADATLRAVAAVCRLLPRLADVDAEAAAAAAAAAASTRSSATGGAATSARRRTAKAEAAAPYAPSLASTTRPTPAAGAGVVSAPTAVEVARYATYYTQLPNLQLQATLCYLHPLASPAVLDVLAHAWALFHYLPGPGCLEAVDAARSAAVLRVRQRIAATLDAANALFYTVLMHLLYDAVGPYSLTVAEVDRRLQWSITLAHDAGSLPAFLRCCGLYVADDGLLLPVSAKQRVQRVGRAGGASSGDAALSSRLRSTRETTQSRTEQLRCHPVKSMGGGGGGARVDVAHGFVELPWRPLPITGERERQVRRLHQAAVEEVLMAMPRVPQPMYIGDVGNLIGKWMHFNTRFDGTLGVNLQSFLAQHPEAFKVLDNIVTRRTAGTTEQVRLRFDDEHEGGAGDSDDDDDAGRTRKARDRALLTGQRRAKDGMKAAIELPARARKKRAIKEFNKERHNRNYKSIDPSARVPGYVKRGPRRIKGRGKKANKRVVKRGA
ncbi:hypothetical protein NESM_000626000 [Novymonas esmeraldas]|uniref:C6H2-type domain-containing protein n=1 Tax=Novymonas esmeraldas TaxID=1808958 RepID=A0AAW0ETU5_9TRYP